MVTVAAFTPGWNIPSARFRVRQYLSPLRAEGIEVSEFVAAFGAYPPDRRGIRPIWAGATLLSRLRGIASSYAFDLTFLQREMVSTFTTLEPLTKSPRVLDLDDAIWLHPRGNFAVRLAKSCQGVICGNAYLAEHVSCWNPRVVIIPTPVDTDRFVPGKREPEPVIGWTGTKGGLKNLHEIEPALAAVLRDNPRARLRIICDERPHLTAVPPDQVEFIPWSERDEVAAIQGMAIGIMPLVDTPWARGKCSFKMLSYMACGLPVVVSPVGMNSNVLKQGNVGLAAVTSNDWIDALAGLLRDPDMRQRMGQEGRRVVVEAYSVQCLTPVMARVLEGFAGKGKTQ